MKTFEIIPEQEYSFMVVHLGRLDKEEKETYTKLGKDLNESEIEWIKAQWMYDNNMY